MFHNTLCQRNCNPVGGAITYSYKAAIFFSLMFILITIIYYYILFNEITETAYTLFFYLQQDDTYLQWQANV